MTAKNIAVIGLGNILLKDDGIGVWLIRELEKMPLPAGIEVYDMGTSVFAIPSLVRKNTEVLIADAMKGGGKPGTFYTLSWEEVSKQYSKSEKTFNPHSLHDFYLYNLAILPETAGFLHRCRVFGVEPVEIDFGYGLTKDLADLLTFLAEALYNEAKKMFLPPI